MAEIQTSLDLEFCINKATEMVYSTDHFGGVTFTFFFRLADAEQVPARAEPARYFIVICVFFGLFMSISCLAIGDDFCSSCLPLKTQTRLVWLWIFKCLRLNK